MYWQWIVFILVIIVIITIAIYGYFTRYRSSDYGEAFLVEESRCIKKRGQSIGKKRCTYKCEDPRGCLVDGKIQKGTFHKICECDVKEPLNEPWQYIPAGPYYGNSLIIEERSREKTSELQLLEPVPCRTCLSVKTGHPISFSGSEIGFTGIMAKYAPKTTAPDAVISTIYENSEDDLKIISRAIEENRSLNILIDKSPFILQPCRKIGDVSFSYFKLSSDSYTLIIENGFLKAVPGNLKNFVYFTLENVVRQNGSTIGNLICYNEDHSKGWLDINMKWHAGSINPISTIPFVSVRIINGKVMKIDGSSFSVTLEGSTSLEIDKFKVSIIPDISKFLKYKKVSRCEISMPEKEHKCEIRLPTFKDYMT